MRLFPYIGLMKLAGASTSSDPNLQRATQIFQDWLTTRKHTVQRGEILTGIAKKEKVNPQELMELNGLQSITAIKPGQVLKVPNGLGKQPKQKGTQNAGSK